MKICIIGCGAIGSTLLMYLYNHFDITVVVRDYERKHSIIREGMKIISYVEKRKTVIRPKVITKDDIKNYSEELYDIIFIAVKAYDIEEALRIAKLLSSENTCVVTLQNGLGVYDLAIDVFKQNAIHGIVTFGAYRKSLNEVIMTSKGGIILGSRYASNCVNMVYNVLKRTGLDVRVVDNIDSWIWLKLLINAAINPMTAILRVKNRSIVEDHNLYRIATAVIKEGIEVAKCINIVLPIDPLELLKNIARETGENISSMLQDVLRCSKTEIEFINGAIVRLGKKCGISTPLNEMLYSMIKYLESRCHKEEVMMNAPFVKSDIAMI